MCRLWHVHNQSQFVVTESRGAARSRPSFAFVNIVLIESALVYSVTVLAITITAFKGSSSYYYIADIVSGTTNLIRKWSIAADILCEHRACKWPVYVSISSSRVSGI